MLNSDVAPFLRVAPENLPPRDLVRNDRVGYSLAVPHGFGLNDFLDVTGKVLTSIYEKPGVGKVRIVSSPIPWPWVYRGANGMLQRDATGMLQAQIVPHRQEVLRLLLASIDRPALAEDRVGVRFGGLDSADPQLPTEFSKFRSMNHGRTCFRYRHYERLDGKDISYVALYIIHAEKFVAVDFSIPTNALRQGATPQELQSLVELALIPLSLTLDP